jgi:hypothetical protein
MRVPSALFALVIASMVSAAFEPAADAAVADASALVTELGAQLGQVLSDRTLSPVEQKQRFRAVLDGDFDFPVILVSSSDAIGRARATRSIWNSPVSSRNTSSSR